MGRIAVSAAVLCAVGCGTVPSEQPETARRAFAGAKLSSLQIRMLLNDFTVRFALRVEAAADRILAGADAAEPRRRALLWKINATSACFLASSRRDPVAALGGVTILTLQMRRFFEDGAGRELFGPERVSVVRVSRELEEEVLGIRDLLSDDKAGLEKGLRRMRDFVEGAPLVDLTFVQESVTRSYLDVILPHDYQLFEVVGGLNEVLAGLQELLVFQVAHACKLARWQAELAVLDIDRAPSVGAALAAAGFLRTALERVTPVVEGVPALLRGEREAVLEAITGAQARVHRDLQEERRLILDAAADQRRLFVGELNDLSQRRVKEAVAGADVLLWRGLRAGLAAGAALVAVVLLSILLLRR